jgi:MFS family permease
MKRITNIKAILGILFLVNFLNFFDRALPAILLEPMRKEFEFSDAMIGMLMTSFTLVYAVMGIPLGRLADKYPRRFVLAGGVFVWSAMTAMCGMVSSAAMLFATRIGVGAGEASCSPASNSLIASLVSSDKRGKALSIFMLGLPLGSIAAFVFAGYLAQMYGWRFPFFVAAAPGVLVIALLLAIKEPPREVSAQWLEPSVASTSASTSDMWAPYKTIFQKKTILWLIGSGIAFNFATNAFNSFLSSFFIRLHGLSIAQSGIYCAIVVGLTGLVGLLMWGPITDKFHAKYEHGRLGVAAVTLLLSGPILWFGLSRPPGDVLSVLLILTVGWLLVFSYYVAVYAALQDVVPQNLVATTMAVYFLFMYLLGAAFGTTLTGYLSDVFAKQLIAAQGAGISLDMAKALGLQQSLSLTIPLSIFITSLFIFGAFKSYAKEKY